MDNIQKGWPVFTSWLKTSQAPVDLLLEVAKILASGSQKTLISGRRLGTLYEVACCFFLALGKWWWWVVVRMEKRTSVISLLVSLELHGQKLVFFRSVHEKKAGQARFWHTYHTHFNRGSQTGGSDPGCVLLF